MPQATEDYRSRLIAARARIGISRRKMAHQMMTPYDTYRQWEQGSRRTPGVAVVAAESLARRPVGRPLTARTQEIITALLRGERQADIARRYEMSRQHIQIINRRAGIKPYAQQSNP